MTIATEKLLTYALGRPVHAEDMPTVRRIVIYADRDVAGMEAAWRLRESLIGVSDVELKLPPAPYGDWCDCLKPLQP